MEWNKAVCRRRIHLLMAAGLLLWIFFIGRFAFLQIIRNEELSEAAELQHRVRIEGLDSRGMILDRNLNPLTGKGRSYYYFIQEERVDSAAAALLETVSAADISEEGNTGSGYRVWRTEQYDEIVSRHLKERCDAYILSLPSRYSSRQTACHLIGYTDGESQTGTAGLEKAFEEQLKNSGRGVSLRADGRGQLLASSAPVFSRENYFTSSGLVTTLDISLQNVCESAMYEREFDGAVLVSEADRGELLAWVSSPCFNPYAAAEFADEEDARINKCIERSYPLGEIFEIVSDAAAYEKGKGKPDTEELMEMAGLLGFGKTVMGIFEEESKGSLSDAGQGILLATPVQIHQMMSAAAAGGLMIPLSVVSSVHENPAKRVFSENTASQIVSAVGPVIGAKTGNIYNWPCPIYGKTGTAGMEQDGRIVNCCWFSGFCRIDEKVFVVTVLVDKGISGEESCLPVAMEIAEYLADGRGIEG